MTQQAKWVCNICGGELNNADSGIGLRCDATAYWLHVEPITLADRHICDLCLENCQRIANERLDKRPPATCAPVKLGDDEFRQWLEEQRLESTKSFSEIGRSDYAHYARCFDQVLVKFDETHCAKP